MKSRAGPGDCRPAWQHDGEFHVQAVSSGGEFSRRVQSRSSEDEFRRRVQSSVEDEFHVPSSWSWSEIGDYLIHGNSTYSRR